MLILRKLSSKFLDNKRSDRLFHYLILEEVGEFAIAYSLRPQKPGFLRKYFATADRFGKKPGFFATNPGLTSGYYSHLGNN